MEQMMIEPKDILDCVVIGAGPAGLMAGIYLQRYLRKIAIIDDQQSRAATIPLSHNYPGFPFGITGVELLKRLREQLENYNGSVIHDTVIRIEKNTSHFQIHSLKGRFNCHKVIIATGVCDIEPSLPNLRETVRRGLIRHCSICDGYEVRDQHIGVIGTGIKGINEALFLKTYSKHITLLTLGQRSSFASVKLRQLTKADIKIVRAHIKAVEFNDNKITSLTTQKGETYLFDTIYSTLGSIVKSKLAIDLGVKHQQQYLIVNHHNETNVPGVYAIGDVVKGLSQICVATAGAALAATHIHNSLRTNQ